MRTYETIFILNPEIAGDDYTAAVDKFKGVLTDQGAEILKVEEWGVRKLAYLVKKESRGNFILFIFDAGPTVVKEFERRMRLDENVMKFQTILLEEGYVPPPVVEEPVAETATEEATTEEAAPAEAATTEKAAPVETATTEEAAPVKAAEEKAKTAE